MPKQSKDIPKRVWSPSDNIVVLLPSTNWILPTLSPMLNGHGPHEMASSGSSTTNSFHKRFQGGGSCFSDTIQTSLSSHPRLGSRSKFITCLVTCSESAPYVFTLFHSVQNTDTNSVGIGSQLQLALSSFYANSLGGLVAKQALVTAKLEGEYNPVYLSTKGLVFFGTLHWGSKIAEIGGTVAKIVRLVRREARNNFIDVLKENSLFTAESRDNSALSKTSLLSLASTRPKRPHWQEQIGILSSPANLQHLALRTNKNSQGRLTIRGSVFMTTLKAMRSSSSYLTSRELQIGRQQEPIWRRAL